MNGSICRNAVTSAELAMLSDSSAASFLAESGLGVAASDGSAAGAVRVAAAGIEAGR